MSFLPSSKPLLLLAMVLLSACHPSGDPGAKKSQAIPVSTAKASRKDIPITFNAIGTVQPKKSVAVKSQVDGIIQSINQTEGADVRAGDLLISLDKRPFENALRLAKADLAQAQAAAERDKADAERYAQLDKALVVSKTEYAGLIARAEVSAAEVEGKKAALADAELKLSYAEIRAPISGRLGQFALREGSLVKANDASVSLVTLHQLAPIDVAFSIPDTLQATLKKGQANGTIHLSVRNRDAGEQPQTGTLVFVNNAIDPGTGTLSLKGEFQNEDLDLWPGAFASVDIELGREPERVVVPNAALQNGQTGPQVFVVKADDTVEMRPVQPGTKADGLTSLLSGVNDGEEVVVDGQLRLTPGAKVQRRNPGAPANPSR